MFVPAKHSWPDRKYAEQPSGFQYEDFEPVIQHGLQLRDPVLLALLSCVKESSSSNFRKAIAESFCSSALKTEVSVLMESCNLFSASLIREMVCASFSLTVFVCTTRLDASFSLMILLYEIKEAKARKIMIERNIKSVIARRFFIFQSAL
jgi:hypothetical protein